MKSWSWTVTMGGPGGFWPGPRVNPDLERENLRINSRIPPIAESRDEPVTEVLQAVARGDQRASAELLRILYDELRRLAQARMARLAPGQTLQPTALVHEAYLRLTGPSDSGWDGQGHFFGAAARAMRDILVDQARRKGAIKRGGDRARADLEEVDLAIQPPDEDVLALDEALRRLEADDPRKGHIVNLRYFAGLTAEETATSLGVSVGTIEREWRYIRTWLRTQLGEP